MIKFSSWRKLIRLYAWWMRQRFNLKCKGKSGLPYSPTHVGTDNPTQHLRTGSWPKDQPKEDRSDAAERVQP